MATTPSSKIEIFNGTNLDGLYTYSAATGYNDPNDVWSVVNGEILATGNDFAYLATDTEYTNFVCIVEFKWTGPAFGGRSDKARDSGVIFHATGKDGSSSDGRWLGGWEAQILEGGMGAFLHLGGTDEEDAFISRSFDCFTSAQACEFANWGCVYNSPDDTWKYNPAGTERSFTGTFEEDVATEYIQPINWDGSWQDTIGFVPTAGDWSNDVGEWNQIYIVANGTNADIYFNGHLTCKVTNLSHTEGKLYLQIEKAEVVFRKWELWPIGSAPTSSNPEAPSSSLILDLNPSEHLGFDIGDRTGTKNLIKSYFINTHPSDSDSVGTAALGAGNGELYYPDTNWRYKVSASEDGGNITPIEGSHFFYARLLESFDQYYFTPNGGGTNWDRITYQIGNQDNFNHGDERWYGWSVFFEDIENYTHSGFHTIFDPHTSGAGSGVASLFAIQFVSNGTIKIFTRNDGFNSQTDHVVEVYDSNNPSWVLGDWMQFVVFARARTNQTGILRVWYRRPNQTSNWTQIYNGTNIWLGFTDGLGDPFRAQHDSYRGASSPTWPRAYALGRIRVGGANSNFAGVEPGQGGGQTNPQVANPTSSIQGGTFSDPPTTTLNNVDSEVTISYTLDNSDPSDSNGTQVPPGTSIIITSTSQLKLMAFKAGEDDSGIVSYNFTVSSPNVTIPIRIDSGGFGLTDENANVWVADIYYNNGTNSSASEDPVNGSTPENEALYQVARFWPGQEEGGYSIPIANGDYLVTLHHNEFFDAVQFVGARVFDIEIEGVTVETDFDVFAAAGADTVYETTYPVSVSDGFLDIQFTNIDANNATIKGIEVLAGDTGPATFSYDPPYEKVLNSSFPYADNLKLLCLFGEGGGSVSNDSSIYRRSGTINNGTWVTDERGKALTFNGTNSNIIYTASNDFNPEFGNYTWEFWVKPDALTSTTDTPGYSLFTKYTGGNSTFYMRIRRLDLLEFQFRNGSTYIFFVNNLDPQFTNDEYNHIVVTLNRADDTLRVYINGEFAGSSNTSLSGASVTITGDLRIGVRSDSNQQCFSGEFQKVAFYKGVAFDQEQVRELYQVQYPELEDVAVEENIFFEVSGNKTKSLAGSLSLSGSTSHIGTFVKSLAGALSLSGITTDVEALVKSLSSSLNLSGDMTYSGAFIKSFASSISFLSSVSGGGTFFKSLAGTLGFSGSTSDEEVTVSQNISGATTSSKAKRFLRKLRKRK